MILSPNKRYIRTVRRAGLAFATPPPPPPGPCRPPIVNPVITYKTLNVQGYFCDSNPPQVCQSCPSVVTACFSIVVRLNGQVISYKQID